MEMKVPRQVCPQCLQIPKVWRERPRFGSRELFWIGCETDRIHMVGGITVAAAFMLWDRYCYRWKFNHQSEARA